MVENVILHGVLNKTKKYLSKRNNTTTSATPVQKIHVINLTMINNLLTLLEANLDKQNFKDKLKNPAFIELLNKRKNNRKYQKFTANSRVS